MKKCRISFEFENRYEFEKGLCMHCPFVVQDVYNDECDCLFGADDSNDCPLTVETLEDD